MSSIVVQDKFTGGMSLLWTVCPLRRLTCGEASLLQAAPVRFSQEDIPEVAEKANEVGIPAVAAWLKARGSNVIRTFIGFSSKWHCTEGNALITRGRYEEAAACLSEAISLDPTNPAFYGNRSLARERAGEFEQALHDAESCIRCDPTYPN